MKTELMSSATGQVPSMGNFGLIDADTPKSAWTFTSMETGEVWDLVRDPRGGSTC